MLQCLSRTSAEVLAATPAQHVSAEGGAFRVCLMAMNRNAHTTMNAVMAAAVHCTFHRGAVLQKATVLPWAPVAVNIKFFPRNIWNLPAFGWLTSQI
jgi:hypothetical protein